MSTTDTTNQRELVTTFAAELHRLATWIDNNPDVMTESAARWGGVTVYVHCDPDELPRRLRSLGSFDKVATDWGIGGVHKFGPHQLRVESTRDETCQRVPTGEVTTRTVTVDSEDKVPEGATIVQRNAKSVPVITYEITEQVTEWDCPPSLLGLTK